MGKKQLKKQITKLVNELLIDLQKIENDIKQRTAEDIFDKLITKSKYNKDMKTNHVWIAINYKDFSKIKKQFIKVKQ